ncbi:MAG: hypothetical protein RL536_437 [Candidatus Parcubacteria bacterium]
MKLHISMAKIIYGRTLRQDGELRFRQRICGNPQLLKSDKLEVRLYQKE